MYHARFKGSAYEAGFHWGEMVKKAGKRLDVCPTFAITKQRLDFSDECEKIYEEYYPEILAETKGIADGNGIDVKKLRAILFSMYSFETDHHCSCIAAKNGSEVFFARNSDFLVSLKKLYMNCLYAFDGEYRFNANTTAYVEMEDGVNEMGLSAGLCFVYPHIYKPGVGAGMMVHYVLAKCSTVSQALQAVKRIPQSSSYTLSLCDKTGDMAVCEINPEKTVIRRPEANENYIVSVNNFVSKEMDEYKNPPIDDWNATLRYDTAVNALKNNNDSLNRSLLTDILSGKHGFMCQYDKKKDQDTVWSVIYDLTNSKIWRAEANPSTSVFKIDERMNKKNGSNKVY